MDLALQIWGGSFYLANKILFSVSEGKVDSWSKKLRICGWLFYIFGVPPWVLILIGNQDWIAASIEAGGLPAMLLGLYVSCANGRKPGNNVYRFVTVLTYTALAAGTYFSFKHHGGISTFSQILEIGVMFGFLLSGYYIANDNSKGWLFFMLGNVCMAALMYIQNHPILMVQQLLSLCFVIYGFNNAIKHKANK